MRVSILIPKLNTLPFLEKSLDLARQQKYGGKVYSYMHAIYSDFTTNTFAEIIDDVIEKKASFRRRLSSFICMQLYTTFMDKNGSTNG